LAEKTINKRTLKTLIKIAITIWSIYYVWSHIDSSRLIETLQVVNIWWLLGAFISFNLSKISSAIRLNYYFRAIDISLDEWSNLKLYYLGMYYNLFLPGGIGGDGYKAYLLEKRYQVGYKRLISSLLLDRISGMVALLLLGGVLFFPSSFAHIDIFDKLSPLIVLGILLVLPLYYILIRKFFGYFMSIFYPTTIYAFVVQLLQIVSAISIVLSLPIESIYMVEYLLLFLISSIVAILPISIGGVGVRELTFLYGFTIIGADTTTAVTFSLLFFIITAISSLIGAFVKVE